ncbi:hypothetical protein GCM10023172_04070 [Hymenobacter ginsengisoli]|uniref:Uncharacterized protein n=1 Tax=Hymenobacter ginsengisoli TaxID=1051626 RepID=A0ABP8Q0D5_9BACT|nr:MULTISPECIES: hypothetical protein [unclassified Hymenobacter]MBO2030508.1 hypothetical protein [Hymenobacter sp. BT559]
MNYSASGRALSALLLGGLLLGACSGGSSDTHTNTPSSTLGTDSAATKVGGMPDSTGTSGTMSAPASGAMNGTSTSPTGGTPGSASGTAGNPTVGGTGASGTTNNTGAN